MHYATTLLFIYTAGISCSSSVIWELTVVFFYLKRLRMTPGAIDVPHLEVRPIKVPNLKWLAKQSSSEFTYCLEITCQGVSHRNLTHRAVSNKGQVKRTSLSLLVSAWSFAGFVASSTARSSYSFVLQSEKGKCACTMPSQTACK